MKLKFILYGFLELFCCDCGQSIIFDCVAFRDETMNAIEDSEQSLGIMVGYSYCQSEDCM